ncbi:MAG: hypothetical protein LC130_35005, partial [Bryobacterales bacterium]|nr:hypothetical protein [Bryobacterales bacterium]
MLHPRKTARLNPRFLFLPALAVLLAIGPWPARAAEGRPQEPLRYAFQAGQTYAYELKIVGE